MYSYELLWKDKDRYSNGRSITTNFKQLGQIFVLSDPDVEIIFLQNI
jgi:hypothetical protein